MSVLCFKAGFGDTLLFYKNGKKKKLNLYCCKTKLKIQTKIPFLATICSIICSENGVKYSHIHGMRAYHIFSEGKTHCDGIAWFQTDGSYC